MPTQHSTTVGLLEQEPWYRLLPLRPELLGCVAQLKNTASLTASTVPAVMIAQTSLSTTGWPLTLLDRS